MRPCRKGMYTLGEINSGLISLVDVARANDDLNIEAANAEIFKERAPNNGERK